MVPILLGAALGVDALRVSPRSPFGAGRWTERLAARSDEVGPRDVGGRRCPEESERQLELLAQETQRMLHAGLAADGQRPEDGPAEQHATCPERQGDRDVEPAAHAAIERGVQRSSWRTTDYGCFTVQKKFCIAILPP